jgi:hypothetical protein
MITANRSIVHYTHLLFLRGDYDFFKIGLFLPSPAAGSLFYLEGSGCGSHVSKADTRGATRTAVT